MLPAPLWLSLLRLSFRSRVPNPVFQVAVVQAEVATPNRCCSYLLPGSYLMPVALEAAPLRPQGDVSCAEAPSLPVPQLPEQSGRGLAPLARAPKWSSSKLLPCGNGTVLNDPPLVYDLLLHLRIQGNCLCGQTARRRFCAMVLAACRNSGTNGGRGIAACGCNTGALIPTLQPSSSSAWGVNSLPSASSSKLPVHRSPGDNRLVVRAFTTPLAVPTITVFDPSIGPKYLPCSNRESKGHQPTVGWLQRHPPHSLTELCQRGNSAPSHISFVCCLAVSTH